MKGCSFGEILVDFRIFANKEQACVLLRRFLISRGADKNALTDEGERPIDLVDPEDKVIHIDRVGW
jgi:hypothetical protein